MGGERMNIKWVEQREAAEGAVIRVVGVGGAGCNSVDRMVGRVWGVELVAIDTDYASLAQRRVDTRLHIGAEITHRCGAGGDPDKGRESAERDRERIRQAVLGADLVIITTGLGRGTGTGATPVVAHLAREVGALTLALVTMPFGFVGSRQCAVARSGLEQVRSGVDAIVPLSSESLLTASPEGATVQDAFLVADSLLVDVCEALSEVMQEPGLINLGISDLRAVLEGSGDALLGVALASGERSWDEAPRSAVKNPMVQHVTLQGARAVLASFAVHPSTELRHVVQAAGVVREEMGDGGDLVLGLMTRADMEPTGMRVLLVGGGVNGNGNEGNARTESDAALGLPATQDNVQTDSPRVGELASSLREPSIYRANRRVEQDLVGVPTGQPSSNGNDDGDCFLARGYRLREVE